jgi:hypothetical protein
VLATTGLTVIQFLSAALRLGENIVGAGGIATPQRITAAEFLMTSDQRTVLEARGKRE